MHARVTTYEVKPGQLEQARSVAEEIKPQITNISGLKEVLILSSYEGNKGMVISIYETKTQAEASTVEALQVWVQSMDYFASTPKSTGYQVWNRILSD